MSGRIQLEQTSDGIFTLWIDNPEHRNALNDSLIESLIENLSKAGGDPACRVVMLRGRNGIFCAGRELRDLRKLQEASPALIAATYERLKRLNEAIYFCPRPTVAVIEKYAFGAGATVVSWCDIAIAESGALLAYPEVHHGITPSPAVMALFRGISRKAAMHLILTGRRIDAVEAQSIGLLSRTVPAADLEKEVAATLKALRRGNPAAIKRTKEFLWHSEDAGHRAAMASAVDSISLGLAAGEAREGIAAFFEKREPNW